jgi:hypothetical protein
MTKIPALLGFAMSTMNTFEAGQENWKKKILDEWEKSKNYPRKKKKMVRKKLQLDWNLACWSPFDDLNIY